MKKQSPEYRQAQRERNLARTHCVNGHPYDAENTRIDYRGNRQCRTCLRRSRTKTPKDKGAAPKANWVERAICAGADVNLFFTNQRGNNRAAYAEGLRICSNCPVKAECLQHALDHNEQDGVWGGTTPSDRDRMKRRVS